MSKKPAKPAAETDASPKKRSKLKLALFALLPLVLAGGGYAGWTQFAGSEAAADAAHGGEAAEENHGQDAIKVSAVPTEIAAETSFTHSFALSVMLAERCGAVDVPALMEASNEEAKADGLLANLSWMAAGRRVNTLTERSCNLLHSEIAAADAKATRIAQAKAAAEKAEKGGDGEAKAGGHEAPAAHH